LMFLLSKIASALSISSSSLSGGLFDKERKKVKLHAPVVAQILLAPEG
jgi:hypothetical protein